MGFNLTTAKSTKTKKASLELEPGMPPIELEYKHRKMTLELVGEFKQTPTKDVGDWLTATLLDLIVDWNITYNPVTPKEKLTDLEGNPILNENGVQAEIGGDPILDLDGNPVELPLPLTWKSFQGFDSDAMINLFFAMLYGNNVDPQNSNPSNDTSSLVAE